MYPQRDPDSRLKLKTHFYLVSTLPLTAAMGLVVSAEMFLQNGQVLVLDVVVGVLASDAVGACR